MSRVEKKLVKAQRAFAAICSCARNAYSREQLKADFQDGLAEMHAQANKGAPSGLTLVLPCMVVLTLNPTVKQQQQLFTMCLE